MPKTLCKHVACLHKVLYFLHTFPHSIQTNLLHNSPRKLLTTSPTVRVIQPFGATLAGTDATWTSEPLTLPPITTPYIFTALAGVPTLPAAIHNGRTYTAFESRVTRQTATFVCASSTTSCTPNMWHEEKTLRSRQVLLEWPATPLPLAIGRTTLAIHE